MKAIEQMERLQRMNDLIKAECTGTPEEFADRLRISRRQLYAEIEYFKDLGVEIGYSRSRRTFNFCNGHEIKVAYCVKVIPKENTKKINGGFSENFVPCFFYARNEPTLALGFNITNP